MEEINLDINTGELQGTVLNAGKGSDISSDLDSLIAETLTESKISAGRPAEQKEEASLAATPITLPKPAQPQPARPAAQSAPAPRPSAPAEPRQAAQPAAQKPAAPQTGYDMTFKSYKIGDIIKGTVAKVDQSGALVDINYQSDGFIDSIEMVGHTLNVGDKIDVCIIALATKEGHVALSLKQAEEEIRWNNLYDSFKFKKSLEVKVASAVGGGLVVDYSGVRGFIPASMVAKNHETALADFVGRTLPAKVIEMDRRRGKVVLSHKMGNAEKAQAEKNKLFETIEAGQVVSGTVSSIKKFGIFVNVDGVEGLVHVNDLSWKRVDDPSKMAKIGQKLDVFVIGVDKEARKLSLGIKQLQPDPWAVVSDKYKAGQVLDVKVLRIAKFGAFAELEEGIEGLIHSSEISLKPIQNLADAVKPGQVVKAKILRILEDEQKIGLSIREAEIDEEKRQFKESQGSGQPQKVTIGDAIGDALKEQLAISNQDELSQPA